VGDSVSGEVVGEADKANITDGGSGGVTITGGGVNTNDTVGGSSSNDLPVAALP
jgi:hypothetical protein